MAKDDYQVVVFRILSYLYKQLKSGEPVDPRMIDHESKLCSINISYWRYIIENMQKEELIQGLKKGKSQEEDYTDGQLKKIQITPKGIEVLSDNKMYDKINNVLKNGVKSLIGL